MDVLAAMQGTNPDGHGKGLSTYPDSPDREQQDAHAACLKLEADGKITRHIDLEHATQGTRYVLWMPVDPNAVAAPVAPHEHEGP